MAFPKITSNHRSVDQITTRDIIESQNQIIVSLNEVLEKIHLDSFSLTELDLLAGQENLVVHGLGREFIGWHIIDKDGYADIYRPTSSAADKSIYLPLVTDIDVTISIIIF